MSRQFLHRWFLAVLIGCLSLPLPARAQIVEPDNSDSIHPGSSTQSVPDSSVDLKQAGQQIFSLTNRFRAQQGRGELKINAELSRAAQKFADYLARTDTFSHTADGKRPSQRIREHGYRYCLVAENIAMEYNSAGFTTTALARAFVTGWRHSPEHRKNLLDGDLEDLGVGIARSKQTGRFYSVQDFGRPKSKAIVFRISNEADTTIRYTVDGQSFTLDPHYTAAHTRCRPPELDLPNARGKGEGTREGEETFYPKKDTHYVIQGSSRGGYTVEVQR
ncbi:MAG TPA: CAP domain-containing protein [Gemmataceae bacterium]|nr:CAP domain-containing protein [Gemmataceae bacterium]